MARLTMLLLFLCSLVFVPMDAGEAAKRNPLPVLSPERQADGSVIFRLSAVKAQAVVVKGQWTKDPVTLVRDDNGLWTGTGTAIPAGIWEYSLVVDGVAMIDPGNVAIKPMNNPRSSILHIPANPPSLWDYQDVAHGTLHQHVYTAKAFGSAREVVVYTPPNYNEKADVIFPMLVLQRGSGDNHQTWTAHGHAHLILDNLIAQQKAKPMVVVMLNGHAPLGHASSVRSDDPAVRWAQSLDGFRKELVEDVIPLVEKNYRVSKDTAMRGIAGLSMGGGQSLGAGLTIDSFGWIGAFSAAAPPSSMIDAALSDAAVMNARLKLLWIAIGKDDFLLERNKIFTALLSEKQIKFEYHLTEGGHSWPVWRTYLCEFLPRLFQ